MSLSASLNTFGVFITKAYTRPIAHCCGLNFILIGAFTPFLNVPFMRTDCGLLLYAPYPLLSTLRNAFIGIPDNLEISNRDNDVSAGRSCLLRNFSRFVVIVLTLRD